MYLSKYFCPMCSNGGLFGREIRICSSCDTQINLLISEICSDIISYCQQQNDIFESQRAPLPNGGNDTNCALVNDLEIHDFMQSQCVNFNDTVRMKFKIPLIEFHGYNFLSFHNLEYLQRFQIVHNALKSYHREFLDYIENHYLQGRPVDYNAEDNRMPKGTISETAHDNVQREFKTHLSDLRHLVKDIVRDYPSAHP
ncbi:hypothetical protein IWQ61_005405 [Dispira simplex]|nr:hypothetical protein IWQ61_005405 [Dispira simplex]